MNITEVNKISVFRKNRNIGVMFSVPNKEMIVQTIQLKDSNDFVSLSRAHPVMLPN